MKRNARESIGGGGFVAVTYEMINSKAYKELSGSALRALILCLRKVKTYHPIDRFNSHFEFTYPEARKQGLGDASFFRGLTQLQKVGFIDCVMRGGARWEGKGRSQYRLSKRWKQYGTPDFKELHKGYCVSVNGNGDKEVF
jgi:hypothetical protein